MQASSLISSLFGLLIGLGIGEILRGLARAWRTKVGVAAIEHRIRIGWLIPLFAALLIMDQTHFYIAAYFMRDAIPFTYFSLLAMVAVVGTYFVCSTFMFPEDPEDWPDFDDYYLRIRRVVVGGILAAKLALIGMAAALVLTGHKLDDPESGSHVGTLLVLANIIALIALIALIFVRNKRISLILLALLNLGVVGQAIIGLD